MNGLEGAGAVVGGDGPEEHGRAASCARTRPGLRGSRRTWTRMSWVVRERVGAGDDARGPAGTRAGTSPRRAPARPPTAPDADAARDAVALVRGAPRAPGTAAAASSAEHAARTSRRRLIRASGTRPPDSAAPARMSDERDERDDHRDLAALLRRRRADGRGPCRPVRAGSASAPRRSARRRRGDATCSVFGSTGTCVHERHRLLAERRSSARPCPAAVPSDDGRDRDRRPCAPAAPPPPGSSGRRSGRRRRGAGSSPADAAGPACSGPTAFFATLTAARAPRRAPSPRAGSSWAAPSTIESRSYVGGTLTAMWLEKVTSGDPVPGRAPSRRTRRSPCRQPAGATASRRSPPSTRTCRPSSTTVAPSFASVELRLAAARTRRGAASARSGTGRPGRTGAARASPDHVRHQRRRRPARGAVARGAGRASM